MYNINATCFKMILPIIQRFYRVTFIVVKAVGMLDLDQHSQKAYCKLFCHGNVELPEKSNCIKHHEMKRVTFYLQQTNRKKGTLPVCH